jgi:thiamine biosynthesis protein ThiS
MSDNPTLVIQVNGEPRRVTDGVSIAAMLSELGLDARKVAVERNFEIVPRSSLGEVVVADGDAFEIVHFVGGG